MAKHDKDIEKLFNQGLGARKIAKELGLKHYATVSKRLIKLGLKRPHGSNQIKPSEGSLNFSFKKNKDNFTRAAQQHLKTLCYLYGFRFLTPDESEPYDLMVDFGDGWKKVQVKSSVAMAPSNNYAFRLVRSRSNTNGTTQKKYSAEDVDYFFLMDWEFNQWLIPFEEISSKTQIVPKANYAGYKWPNGGIW